MAELVVIEHVDYPLDRVAIRLSVSPEAVAIEIHSLKRMRQRVGLLLAEGHYGLVAESRCRLAVESRCRLVGSRRDAAG